MISPDHFTDEEAEPRGGMTYLTSQTGPRGPDGWCIPPSDRRSLGFSTG